MQLYEKGGNNKKALDLSVRYNIKTFSGNFNENDDPVVLERTATFLMENSQHEKAVQLLIQAKNLEEAMDTCEKFDVQLNEEMADRIVPEKSGDPVKDSIRNGILLRIAKMCKKQGNFILACKKYTQAG